jgi:hypothetical protein
MPFRNSKGIIDHETKGPRIDHETKGPRRTGAFQLDLPICRLDIPGSFKCTGTASWRCCFSPSYLEPFALKHAVHRKGDAKCDS